jgi:hypothetical protein
MWTTNTTVPRLHAALGEAAAATLAGHICVFGGRADSGVTGDTWCVDIAPTASAQLHQRPMTWTQRAPNGVPRSGLAAVTIGKARGAALVLGGLLSSGISTSATDVYDYADDSWTSIPPMPTARNGLGVAATTPDCTTVLAIGGYHADGHASPDGHLAVVEALDLTVTPPRWTTAPPMGIPRSGFGLATIATDYTVLVVVAGGAGLSHAALQSVEVFNVSASQWTELPPMVRRRTYLGFGAFASPLRRDTVTLVAFGGTNCSQMIRVNGTLRCVSMPSTEVVTLQMGHSCLSSATSAWTILPDDHMPLPVHAGALTNLAANSATCVLGGETASNVFSAAAQCWAQS